MGALRLSDEQWDELDRLRFSAGNAKVFRNSLFILMSDREVGRSRRSVAGQDCHHQLSSQRRRLDPPPTTAILSSSSHAVRR
jgi:hypothetical protein